jgi:hypothetical protein
LLAGTLARAEPEAAVFRVARVSVELLRPVPIAGTFEIRLGSPRAGRQVQRLEAFLLADEVAVAQATCLRVRRVPLDRVVDPPTRALPPPESVAPFHFSFFRTEPAYSTAMDVRLVEGRPGDLTVGAWGRPRVPLVAGEETSSIERAMLFADAESGVAPPFDLDAFVFVNPELTVHFARLPEGEWIGMRVSSHAAIDGIGLAESELYDRSGSFGRAAQSLVIRAREPGGAT